MTKISIGNLLNTPKLFHSRRIDYGERESGPGCSPSWCLEHRRRWMFKFNVYSDGKIAMEV